ncbi:MAG: Gfo/Idh/MocA family protein [Pseudobdellovibrionaceae bacterium]
MTPKQNIKTAVIGVGYLGRFHAQKLKQIPGSNLVGVFDASAEQCRKVAVELEVRAFRNIEECLSEVEAVVIATSTPFHAEILLSAINKGIHVLVEKPMTEWAKQGVELVALAQEKNLNLGVGQIERFNPCFQWLNENLFIKRRSSDLEKILAVELFRLAPFRLRGSDVSVVQDLLIHDVDLMLWLMKNQPVKTVALTGSKLMSAKLDFVQAHLTCDGVPFFIHVNRTAPQISRSARIITNQRVLEINSQTLEIQISTFKRPTDEIPCVIEKIQIEKKDALLLENMNFIHSVLGTETLLCPGSDGLKSLQLCESIETKILQSLS